MQSTLDLYGLYVELEPDTQRLLCTSELTRLLHTALLQTMPLTVYELQDSNLHWQLHSLLPVTGPIASQHAGL